MEVQKFKEWIKEFPELDKLWNKLPLIPKTLFEIQIENYTNEQIQKQCKQKNNPL